MKLLHYRSPVPNFGDDLNAFLWPDLAPSLFIDGDGSSAFVGIGTIVGIDPEGSRKLHVFSSGAGYSSLERWKDLDIEYHCVRGPVTARFLGLEPDRILTDGALLAPLLPRFRPGAREIGNIAVVPHYETLAHPGWEVAVQLAGFDLIDPRGSPDIVIAALSRASLVLTESLHGAILADSCGVPWRGFAVSRNFSTAKWYDWTTSLALDVEIALVPPPDLMPLLRFGKRREPFGSMLQLDSESALREFGGRVGPPAHASWIKERAKQVLEDVPMARRLLGYTPERTAEALARLAALPPFLSSEHVRDRLRDMMLDRLDRLVRAQAPLVAF